MQQLFDKILDVFSVRLPKTVLNGQAATSIHKFTAPGMDGRMVDFGRFKGKKVLIVNTASRCKLTPQFKQLQALYTKYGHKNFVIAGFPTNDFGRQDPGSNSEIKSFCEKNYGVTFVMMEKVQVKGYSTNPVYKWLTSKKENGLMDSDVTWNFQKYMIDEEGQLVGIVAPWRRPDCRKIVNWIEGR